LLFAPCVILNLRNAHHSLVSTEEYATRVGTDLFATAQIPCSLVQLVGKKRQP
ncbi:hypothetical protein HHI36_003688, partial [Cryptolaemus montrouzieri]